MLVGREIRGFERPQGHPTRRIVSVAAKALTEIIYHRTLAVTEVFSSIGRAASAFCETSRDKLSSIVQLWES